MLFLPFHLYPDKTVRGHARWGWVMTSIVLESCFNVSAARVSLLKFTERFDAGAADYNFY